MNKFLFLISLLIVVALGILDHLTGYEISFSTFYLLPISLVAWYRRISYGIIFSILSAMVWLFADLSSGHEYSVYWVPVWNMLMRLIVFIVIVFLLDKIKKELELTKMLSNQDSLTGLHNTRSFIHQSTIEKNRAARFKRTFMLAYIDIDNFKEVNDTFGHAKGDALLKSVGKTIKENLRAYDIPARLGGDEFIIFFSETDRNQAELIIEKIKISIEKIMKEYSNALSLSIGVLVVQNPDSSIEEMIKAADELMYAVKKKSKDGIAYGRME